MHVVKERLSIVPPKSPMTKYWKKQLSRKTLMCIFHWRLASLIVNLSRKVEMVQQLIQLVFDWDFRLAIKKLFAKKTIF